MARPPTPLFIRFWAKVDKTPGQGPEGTCWVWTAARLKAGYGRIRGLAGQPTGLAHRVSYELFSGEKLDKETCVCHTCDNPPCVNPEHFFLGTRTENILDRDLKGRGIFGETHHKAKLKTYQIQTIRKDNRSAGILGALYGVSESTIYRVKSRTIWSHVGEVDLSQS